MLVDDHPIFLDAIGAAMSRKFPESDIRLMSNVAEARNELGSGTLPALAVVDINLPDGSGIDLIEDIHARGVPIIAFSGQADRFMIDACLKRGASVFVEKSCDTALFYSAVDAVLAGQPAVSGASKYRRIERGQQRIRLTRRQKDVLEGVTRALSNKAIADELEVSEGTVKNHVSSLLTIFGANSRNELALRVRDQRFDILE
ncbi:MAG TPA: response regulator transcription factor [Burkholderiaceae bacterium]